MSGLRHACQSRAHTHELQRHAWVLYGLGQNGWVRCSEGVSTCCSLHAINHPTCHKVPSTSDHGRSVLCRLKPEPCGPLHYACAYGLLEMATMLVEVGADVELRTADEFGFTALTAAAQEGHDQIVRMLLERGGADPNVATAYNGTTPLHFAASHDHLDAVKVLVEVGGADVNLARTSEGSTPLHAAAQEGHLEIVRHSCRPAVQTSTNSPQR